MWKSLEINTLKKVAYNQMSSRLEKGWYCFK